MKFLEVNWREDGALLFLMVCLAAFGVELIEVIHAFYFLSGARP